MIINREDCFANIILLIFDVKEQKLKRKFKKKMWFSLCSAKTSIIYGDEKTTLKWNKNWFIDEIIHKHMNYINASL